MYDWLLMLEGVEKLMPSGKIQHCVVIDVNGFSVFHIMLFWLLKSYQFWSTRIIYVENSL